MTPLTELNLETAVPANLAEWLGGYFDGGAHDVGAHALVLFPQADITFGQGAPRSPLAGDDDTGPGLEIRVVRLNVTRGLVNGQWPCDTVLYTGKLAEDRVLFQFQVRAKRGGARQSALLAAQASQLLHAILNSPATRWAVAQPGITHLSARLPEEVPQTDFALRLVHCTARLTYAIRLGTVGANPVLVDGAGQTYRLRVVDDAGAPQLELVTEAAAPSEVVTLVDAQGNSYALTAQAEGPQLELTATAAPGAQQATLTDAAGNQYRVRLVNESGAPQLELTATT